MPKEEIREAILDVIEASLQAQLQAVKRLRPREEQAAGHDKGPSHVSMAYEVLKRAKTPLHLSEIIGRIEAVFGVRVDRDSLGSALTKKVAKGDRFVRYPKNVFGLRDG